MVINGVADIDAYEHSVVLMCLGDEVVSFVFKFDNPWCEVIKLT